MIFCSHRKVEIITMQTLLEILNVLSVHVDRNDDKQPITLSYPLKLIGGKRKL